jgi:aromatic-amino-acid transaminase
MHHLIPSRQGRPDADLIFALNAEATARRDAGESVIDATIGTLLDDDGRLAVLPTAARVLRQVATDEWAGYAPIAGTPEFTAAVVQDCFVGHAELAASATAVATPGGTGALRHAIANWLEPGQALLTTSSFWGPYQTLSDEQDRALTTFSMFDSAGGLDLGALDQRLAHLLERQRRVLLFVNDPCHNPTGYSLGKEEWSGVVDLLLRHAERGPVTLLCDMAYYRYGSADDPRMFLTELRRLLGRAGLLFAWSASKSFTHYGLRIGALVACEPEPKTRRAVAATLAHSCRGTWSNCNHGGQVLITRLLTDSALAAACDAERDDLKRTLMRRVVRFNELARPRGLRYPRYEGGFFVTVFVDDASERAARMREAGVFVVPLRDSLRVALCSVAERDIERLVDSMAAQ